MFHVFKDRYITIKVYENETYDAVEQQFLNSDFLNHWNVIK